MNVILVTGAAGFIGSNFVRLILRETSFHVVVIDKFNHPILSLSNLSAIDQVTTVVMQ
jgi:dTDP-D-glucose 4,6-dehydratase